MLLIGLMSGTSVDGIDAALVEITGGPRRHKWRLRKFVCVPWDTQVRQAILGVCLANAPLQSVVALHYRLGEEFAKAARLLIEPTGLTFEDVDAIASHGQTVWHQPAVLDEPGIHARGTLQIGEPAIIAARTGVPVVADFRSADMALGGQGAPLVPFADALLFGSHKEARAVQNIGGMANVTFLPCGADLNGILAFDTGPGNVLIDALVVRITEGARRFDQNGALAAAGTVNKSLLTEMLGHPFFRQSPPKSTGREEFGAAYAEKFWKRGHALRCSSNDLLATATALTAESIALSYTEWLNPRERIGTVILGGGGVHNTTLVRMLTQRVFPTQVTNHAAFGLPDDAKEAMAFALLAYETLHGRPSNVPAATGATGRAILGKIALPPMGVRKVSVRLDKSKGTNL